MRLLLDTHAVLWVALDDRHLPKKAREAILDDANAVHFSIASVWEIAIKVGIGKLPHAARLAADLREGTAMPGFTELAISRTHAVEAGLLNLPHKDPFDRLLIAQARLEGMTLISNERLFDRFAVKRLWD
jgi:PIN domain nuclease of toxin-antitoxin system